MWVRVGHDLCVYTADYIPSLTPMHLTSHHEWTGRPLAFSVKTPSSSSLDLR